MRKIVWVYIQPYSDTSKCDAMMHLNPQWPSFQNLPLYLLFFSLPELRMWSCHHFNMCPGLCLTLQCGATLELQVEPSSCWSSSCCWWSLLTDGTQTGESWTVWLSLKDECWPLYVRENPKMLFTLWRLLKKVVTREEDGQLCILMGHFVQQRCIFQKGFWWMVVDCFQDVCRFQSTWNKMWTLYSCHCIKGKTSRQSKMKEPAQL